MGRRDWDGGRGGFYDPVGQDMGSFSRPGYQGIPPGTVGRFLMPDYYQFLGVLYFCGFCKYSMGHKKFPFSVKQWPCNGNFVFRSRSVLHISVFIFAAWAKLFFAHGTVKKL